jgi:hypothetical protein
LALSCAQVAACTEKSSSTDGGGQAPQRIELPAPELYAHASEAVLGAESVSFGVSRSISIEDAQSPFNDSAETSVTVLNAADGLEMQMRTSYSASYMVNGAPFVSGDPYASISYYKGGFLYPGLNGSEGSAIKMAIDEKTMREATYSAFLGLSGPALRSVEAAAPAEDGSTSLRAVVDGDAVYRLMTEIRPAIITATQLNGSELDTQFNIGDIPVEMTVDAAGRLSSLSCEFATEVRLGDRALPVRYHFTLSGFDYGTASIDFPDSLDEYGVYPA